MLGLAGGCGWFAGMLAISALAGALAGIGPAVALLAAIALPLAAVLLAGVPERSAEPDPDPARVADALRRSALENA